MYIYNKYKELSMSLISTASSWENDIPPIPKKKISNIRKMLASNKNNEHIEGFTTNQHHTSVNQPIPQMPAENTRSRIHSLIEKMTTKEENNAGEDLVNFKPIQYPENEFVSPSYTSLTKTSDNGIKYYTPNSPNLGKIQTNYSTAYDQRIHTPTSTLDNGNKPYYSSFGIGGSSAGGNTNEKLMERINYMIHLLEEQQMEKTNYVMEEFIMYSFLGVFMIYVCDSFSTAGKYVR